MENPKVDDMRWRYERGLCLYTGEPLRGPDAQDWLEEEFLGYELDVIVSHIVLVVEDLAIFVDASGETHTLSRK